MEQRDEKEKREKEEVMNNQDQEASGISENKWQSLFNAVGDAIFLMDTDHKIRMCNKAMEDFVGKTNKEIVGRSCYELMHDSSRPVEGCPIQCMKGSLKRESMELELDGKYYHITADPVLNDDGELIEIVHTIKDITDRKRIEKELRESEEKYRLLADNVSDIIFIMSTDLKFIYISPSVYKITGYTVEEVIEQPIEDVMTVDSYETALELFEKDLAKDLKDISGSRTLDLELKHKNGSIIWIEVIVSFLFNQDGVPDRIMGTIRDISERKQLEEQLRQALKMEAIGRLAGGVAHDFNNALTTIMGISELLLMKMDPEDYVSGGINEIRRAGNQCAGLTRQLLAFARKQPMEMKVLDLNNVIINIDKMLSRLIGEDVKLEQCLTSDLKSIKADIGQIEQIILNLAVNARDAMPNGGKLIIETANVFLDEDYADRHISITSGHYVMLAVSDTGSGMDKETSSKVFEPFFTTKEESKGTGLGLSTVYGIVKQSNGYIWVYSEQEMGTVFKIYFPIVDEVADVIEEETHTAPGRFQGSETILLVEDDDSTRKTITKILSRIGYIILEAVDGEEAVKISQEYNKPIHLVISDVVLPGMNGKELTEKLISQYPDIKAIYMSGYTDNIVVQHDIIDKGEEFFQKPLRPGLLLSKVRSILEM